MLGKIWGAALLVLGLYIGFEVMRLPETDDQGAKKDSGQSKSTESQRAADSSEVQTAKDSATPNSSQKSPAESIKLGSDGKPELFREKTNEEIARDLAQICEEMEDELRSAKITPLFKDVRLKYHEKRLQNDFMNESLKSCFRVSKAANTEMEIEIFSSDFQGEARDQIQLQISLFDGNNETEERSTGNKKASGIANKIFEIGRKLETQKKIPSLSTRDQK